MPVLAERDLNSVVVKIDVEGAETDVIMGGFELIKALHPILIVEKDHPGGIEETLKPLGYRASRLFGSYWLFTLDPI